MGVNLGGDAPAGAAPPASEAAERERALFANASHGIVFQDASGTVVAVNPAAERILGLTLAQLQGREPADPRWKTVREDGSPLPREAHPALLCLASGRPVLDVTLGMLNPTQACMRWLLVSSIPLFRPGEQAPFQACTTLVDVTERKRLDDALREGAKHIQSVITATPLILWEVDKTGRIRLSEGRALASLGLRSGELVGQSVLDLYANTPEVLAYIQRGLAGEEFSAEAFVGGHSWHNHYAPMRDERGNVTGLIGVSMDVTEQKEAERALRESEERFKLSMEATSDGLWEWKVQTDEGYFSPGYYRMLGYEEGGFDARGEAWKERIHPEDLERALRANLDCIEGRSERFEVEYRMRARSGEWRWVLGRGKCVARDAQGRALRVIGTHVDITARKRAEEEKARLEIQLLQAQKMESVGRLAGGVAHDFNNMLAVILGHLDLVQAQAEHPMPVNADLEEIRKAATRSADLTRQLLAFARQQPVTPRDVDLNETVAGMLKMLQRLIGENIQLAWRPARRLWLVHIDPSQCDQILTNLCVNARDAITDVGHVTIETGTAIFDEVWCAAHPGLAPGDYVRLTVSDDGCGMDEETLAHLFEPFYTTKSLGHGTGLGLATVYGIVKQNGGWINVESAPGKGTTFAIYLPRREAGAAAEAAEAGVVEAPGGGQTILLVEDEPAILSMTSRLLRRQGYTVLAAGSPSGALRLALAHTGAIDLLLTDVIMPEMNGPELAGRVRSICPRMKRLFMSGYTANVIARHGVTEGGVDFMQKPFTQAELIAKVRAALAQE